MRGGLMRRWTREQHIKILEDNTDNREAANAYMSTGRATEVSTQNVAYWRKLFLENGGNLARTDRELAEGRRFIKPQPDDDFGDLEAYPAPSHSKAILVIPDMHAPYQHPDTLRFLTSVRDAFKPDTVVNLGDEIDMHAMSFHDSDPNLDSAGTELEKAKKFLEKLHRVFPHMLICHSNHGSMLFRKAKAHGIPVQMIKRYRDVLFPEHGAPGWSWAYGWRIDTPLGVVMFKHQSSGDVVNDAAHNCCNLVVGHEHGLFGARFAASSAHLYYGANGGCLIDKDALAFAYGKHSLKKPIIGCLVILDGKPIPVPMVLKGNGRWRGTL